MLNIHLVLLKWELPQEGEPALEGACTSHYSLDLGLDESQYELQVVLVREALLSCRHAVVDLVEPVLGHIDQKIGVALEHHSVEEVLDLLLSGWSSLSWLLSKRIKQ